MIHGSTLVGAQALQKLKAFLGYFSIQTIVILVCDECKNCQRAISHFCLFVFLSLVCILYV